MTKSAIRSLLKFLPNLSTNSWENVCIIQGDHSVCAKPPVDCKTIVPLWLGLGRPGQSGTFVLKSTGGFAQAEWSPYRSSKARKYKPKFPGHALVLTDARAAAANPSSLHHPRGAAATGRASDPDARGPKK